MKTIPAGSIGNKPIGVSKASDGNRCELRLLRGGVLLAIGSLLALACAADNFEPWPEPDPANAPCCEQKQEPPSRVSFEPWPEPDSTANESALSAAGGGSQLWHVVIPQLDVLRGNAALGNADAAARLAQQLVDRFEASQSKDDLFEAMLWIDRYHGTDAVARSGVIGRVAARHCDQKALRFHWLCAAAE